MDLLKELTHKRQKHAYNLLPGFPLKWQALMSFPGITNHTALWCTETWSNIFLYQECRLKRLKDWIAYKTHPFLSFTKSQLTLSQTQCNLTSRGQIQTCKLLDFHWRSTKINLVQLVLSRISFKALQSAFDLFFGTLLMLKNC